MQFFDTNNWPKGQFRIFRFFARTPFLRCTMVVSTRNTPRYPSESSNDVEMEEAYQHLALPAPHEPEGADLAITLAIQPPTHHEPTL